LYLSYFLFLTNTNNFRDVFPGVNIASGVCNFLRDKNYSGDDSVKNASEVFNEPVMKNLGEFDIFIKIIFAHHLWIFYHHTFSLIIY